MTVITNVGEMNGELTKRCRTAGLQFQCGGDGSFGATIAIVGEAPGEREVALHSPLVGASGKYLWDVLRKYDISRRNLYVTNVVKRQLIIAGEDDKIKISKQEFAQWMTTTLWELQQLPNLQHVLILGNMALTALTGETGITKWRGSVLQRELRWVDEDHSVQSKPLTFVVANNPALVLRKPETEIIFRFDMGKFNRVLKGEYREHKIEHFINSTAPQALEWIAYYRDQASKGTLIAHDIETMANETACVGLSSDPHVGHCINFRDVSANRYTVQEEADIRLALQEFYSEPTLQLVAQNGGFDAYWLRYKDRLRVPRGRLDTLLAHHWLYPSLPHNLGFLTAQYTDHPFYKDDGKGWREKDDIDQYWRYNVKDACITVAVAEKEAIELREQNLERGFYDHVMRLQPHLVEMTVHGIACDIDLKNKIATELCAEVEQIRNQFHEAVAVATGDPEYKPNLQSPKQLKELYFTRLKLVGRGQSTDKHNRARMMGHPRTRMEDKEVLRLHGHFATEQKFYGTYASSEVDPDNRFRCDWKQYGVVNAPGRLSSAQTMWGSGMNLQNQNERSKAMFIADPGFTLVYFDMAQIEARIVGWRAPVPKWMEQFEKARLEGGYDAHRALASEMFKVPYDDVPKEDWDSENKPTIRYIAKRCRHGLNYRMMPARLAETAKMSMRDAERNWHAYHYINPEIQEWWEHTIDEVKQTNELYNPYGRRWRLLERFSDEALESIIAFYPQSTAGDHVAGTIYLCHEDERWPRDRLGNLTARIVLNVHDALIALCLPEHAKLCASIMKEHAERPIIIRDCTPQRVERELIIPADFAVGTPDDQGVIRWSNMRKIKNFNEWMKEAAQ